MGRVWRPGIICHILHPNHDRRRQPFRRHGGQCELVQWHERELFDGRIRERGVAGNDHPRELLQQRMHGDEFLRANGDVDQTNLSIRANIGGRHGGDCRGGTSKWDTLHMKHILGIIILSLLAMASPAQAQTPCAYNYSQLQALINSTIKSGCDK